MERSKRIKGLVNLSKNIWLIVLLAVIILFLLFVGGTDTDPTINLLTYMIAGAIALPTVIWVIMSLYHKMGGKRA